MTAPSSVQRGSGSPAARLVSGAPEVLGSFVAGWLVVGTILVLADAYRPAVAAPLGALAGLALAAVALRIRSGVRDDVRWDGLALLVAIGFGIWNGLHTAHDILTYRDPATYVNASEWLAHHGGLVVPSHLHSYTGAVPGDAFSAGFSPDAPGTSVYPQGMHAVVVLSAVGGWFGQHGVFIAAPVIAALALLALYGAARRFVPSGWALLAVVGFGVTLPALAFTRDTYSEPTGMLVLFSGLALFACARGKGPLAHGVASLVFSCTAMSRVDGYLSLLGVVVVAVLVLIETDDVVRGIRIVAALAVGVAVPAVLGFLDLTRIAPFYYTALRHNLALIAAGVLVACVAGAVVVVGARVAATRALWDRVRPAVAIGLGVLVPVVFAGLAVRSHLSHKTISTSDPGSVYLKNVLGSQGLPFQLGQDYERLAGLWAYWYVGPVTAALGYIGLGFLLWKGVRRKPALLPLLVVVLVTALLYTASPSITPDQIWASRRLMPVALPGLFLGVAALGALLTKRKPTVPWLGAGVVLAAVTVVVPLVIDAPLTDARERAAQLGAIDAVCAALPSDAAVIVAPADANALTQAVRSFCQVPAVTARSLSPALLAEERAGIEASGRHLYVVGDPAQVAGTTVVSTTYTAWQTPVGESPDGTYSTKLALAVALVQADGSLTGLR